MKTFTITIVAIFILGMNFSFAPAVSDIETANKAGKTVFLVVVDLGVAGIDQAITIANQAQEKYPNSTVIKMNRSDAANAQFVKKNRLATAQLPLILVIPSNGIIDGGALLANAHADALVKLIPSPKKAEVIETLSKGKSVFIVVSSKSMAEKSEIVNTCQQACIEMERNAKIIEIDLDDPQEKAFLASLKIDPNITRPQTYVINSQGQVTGNFSGDVNSQNLVAKAKTVVKSGGCCPGGSSKGCK